MSAASTTTSDTSTRRSTVEIASDYAEPRNVRDVLYGGLPSACRFEKTRVYEVEWRGGVEAFERFVDHVLVDRNSETRAVDDPPLRSDYVFYVDVALKPTVLDLEKEALLEYLDETPSHDLAIESLRICHRYYFYGERLDDDVLDRILRHLVNPVIHEWGIEHA